MQLSLSFIDSTAESTDELFASTADLAMDIESPILISRSDLALADADHSLSLLHFSRYY